MVVAFNSIDAVLVTAAEGLGASKIRAIANVFIPLALPGIAASAFIVFVVSLGFYVTPMLLGGGNTPFIATLINYDLFQTFDIHSAQATAVISFVIAGATIIVALLLVGKERLVRALG